MKRILGIAMLAAALVSADCGKDNGPTAGNLLVKLTSPNSGADSAIVFTITGPVALTSVAPGAGLRVFQQPLGGLTTRFALVGQLTTGATILTIGVSNTGQVSQYTGAISGVAQSSNYQLRALTGYQLTVTR